MPEKENLLERRLFISAGFEPIEFTGVNGIHLEIEHDEEAELKEIRFNPGPIEFKVKVRIKNRRKSFKKWLMSKGYSRDIADKACERVSLMNGKISYASMYWLIMCGVTLEK